MPSIYLIAWMGWAGMRVVRCGGAGSPASSAASALIVELHLRLGPKLKPKAAKIGAGFVDTCLHHLRASVSRIRALALDAAAPPPPVAAAAVVVNAAGGGGSSSNGVRGGGGVPVDDDGGGSGRVFEKMGQLLGAGGGEGWNGSRTSQRHNR